MIKPILTIALTLALGACSAYPISATAGTININGQAIHLHIKSLKRHCAHSTCHEQASYQAEAKGQVKNIAAISGLPLKKGEKLDTKLVQICQVSQKDHRIFAECNSTTTTKAQ